MERVAERTTTPGHELGTLVAAIARNRSDTAKQAIAAEPSARVQRIVAPVAVGIAYFVAAELGAWLAFPSAPVSALWAPNAIVLAALILARRERWWAYLAAVLPFHFAAQLPDTLFAQVVIQYLMNLAEALIAAIAIDRLCPKPVRFDQLRSATVLIVFGGLLSPFITSAVLASLFTVFAIPNEIELTILARTITNTFAVVTLVPLLAHGAHWMRSKHDGMTKRAVEAGVLAMCLALTGFLVFVALAEDTHASPILLYAPLPLLIWAATRFGVPGACLAALLVGALSTWGVLHGHGPFIGSSPAQNALTVVGFQVLTALALLMLAVLLEERRRAEGARVNAESLRAAVLASLQDQVVVLDGNGMVIETNESWRRCAGVASSHRFDCIMAGQNLAQACSSAAERGEPGAAEERDALRAVLTGVATRRQLELTEITPAGPAWFELSIEQLRRPGGGAVVTRKDVTARKRAELDAHDQRQQLAHLGRTAVLGELSGAFAHELNQPLTSILGNAETALRLLEQGGHEESLQQILTEIVEDDERAVQVIRRLRDMLRKNDLERVPVSVQAALREVLKIAHGELATRHVIPVVELDEGMPPIMGDRVQLQQVFLNLLMNACQAMEELPPSHRRLVISGSYVPGERSIDIRFRDTGCGIAPGELERIFHPFVTTKAHGMGLGLTICRSVAQAHRGRLWAENDPQGGAVFRLILPIDPGGQ
jgi:signal transduction histidine kinase